MALLKVTGVRQGAFPAPLGDLRNWTWDFPHAKWMLHYSTAALPLPVVLQHLRERHLPFCLEMPGTEPGTICMWSITDLWSLWSETLGLLWVEQASERKESQEACSLALAIPVKLISTLHISVSPSHITIQQICISLLVLAADLLIWRSSDSLSSLTADREDMKQLGNQGSSKPSKTNWQKLFNTGKPISLPLIIPAIKWMELILITNNELFVGSVMNVEISGKT